MRHFKHLGYPGGCLDCRARGEVYGNDGIQICGHYDACTEEFLAWQTERLFNLREQAQFTYTLLHTTCMQHDSFS